MKTTSTTFATSLAATALSLFSTTTLACHSCYGPINHVEHVRHVPRMQPGAPNATYGPTRPLEWGQLNVLHTSDTHGWLSGHIKEANYGADFGDVVSFVKHMKHKAGNYGVDLLLIDTGDLHDGTGLSDATTPDGALSNRVFEELDEYDLLTIGNHELYVSDVAYDTFYNFSTYWGDRYLTSNVQIHNNATGQFEYIGKTHKYFTTAHGLRIMAFGILYDFTGATTNAKVIPAKNMTQQQWFIDAINTPEPVDIFLLLGHNIARPTTSSSTFSTVYNAIRAVHKDIPIQIFGGHSHIRDFAVVDQSTTALEPGRYCETLGWWSMSGFNSTNSGYSGVSPGPRGVPTPTRKALANSTSPFTYSRRYLDWNRATFEYHAIGKQDDAAFDLHSGLSTSAEITAYRQQLRLGTVYGCVPEAYCQTCVPFNATNNIFSVLSDALATIVVNPARVATPRIILANTGSIRFDLLKGPFTYDDNFIVSPFRDVFLYIPSVSYSAASTLLAKLNQAGASDKKMKMKRESLPNGLAAAAAVERDICVDPVIAPLAAAAAALEMREMKRRGGGGGEKLGITRRQVVDDDLTPGYTTTDDFGADGDDTVHSRIPSYSIPDYFGVDAGFPTAGGGGGGGLPDVVDVVFVDFIESDILSLLGSAYTAAQVSPFVAANFTTQDYLLPYVEQVWSANKDNCPSV